MASTPDIPPPAAGPLLDADGRVQAKRWLDTWAKTGPLLDRERWDRVKALTEADAARDALQLFDLWQPDWPTDNGDALLRQQAVFARARRRV